jgi:3-methyladenine DNA glycosylase AlkD
MMNYLKISAHLQQLSHSILGQRKGIFFKSGKGEYAEGDRFLGITVPVLRDLSKQWKELPLDQISLLLASAYNEERLLGLFILVSHYQKTKSAEQKELIYDFYLNHLDRVNNWNLVDSSAHLILGAYLSDRVDKSILITLTQSQSLWHRRIAMIATLYFIRKFEYEWSIKIADLLLHDTEDLIHKAVGWMLREIGQKEQSILLKFLDLHAHKMPRTALRYAIEKLQEPERKEYLQRKTK